MHCSILLVVAKGSGWILCVRPMTKSYLPVRIGCLSECVLCGQSSSLSFINLFNNFSLTLTHDLRFIHKSSYFIKSMKSLKSTVGWDPQIYFSFSLWNPWILWAILRFSLNLRIHPLCLDVSMMVGTVELPFTQSLSVPLTCWDLQMDPCERSSHDGSDLSSNFLSIHPFIMKSSTFEA